MNCFLVWPFMGTLCQTKQSKRSTNVPLNVLKTKKVELSSALKPALHRGSRKNSSFFSSMAYFKTKIVCFATKLEGGVQALVAMPLKKILFAASRINSVAYYPFTGSTSSKNSYQTTKKPDPILVIYLIFHYSVIKNVEKLNKMKYYCFGK